MSDKLGAHSRPPQLHLISKGLESCYPCSKSIDPERLCMYCFKHNAPASSGGALEAELVGTLAMLVKVCIQAGLLVQACLCLGFRVLGLGFRV